MLLLSPHASLLYDPTSRLPRAQGIDLLAAEPLLETTLAEQPEDDDVRSMLGLALRVARRDAQGRQVLAPLLAEGREEQAARLARRLVAHH